MIRIFFFLATLFLSSLSFAQPATLTNRLVQSEKFFIQFPNDFTGSKFSKQIFNFPGFAVLYRPPLVSFTGTIPASQLKVSPRATFHLKKDGPVYAEIDEKGVLLIEGVPRCRLCFNEECTDEAIGYFHFYADYKAKLPIDHSIALGEREPIHCRDFFRLNPDSMTFGKGQVASLTKSDSDPDNQGYDGYYYRYTALLHDFDGDYGVIKGAGENGEDIYVKYHPDEHPYLHIMTPHVRFHELMERYNPDFKERFKILAEYFEKNEEVKKFFDTLTNEIKDKKYSDLSPENRQKYSGVLSKAGPSQHLFLKIFFNGGFPSEFSHYAIAKKDRFELWLRHYETKTYSYFEFELPLKKDEKKNFFDFILHYTYNINLDTISSDTHSYVLYYSDTPISKESNSISNSRTGPIMFLEEFW